MSPALPLRLVAGSTLLIAAAYGGAFRPGGAPGWAPWAMLVGTSTLLVATMLLGAGRRSGSLRPLALPLTATYVVLFGCLGLALVLAPEARDAPLWLGLPRRAALVLYGVGLLPSAILPFAYARTFDSLTLTPEDLERIRQARARRTPEDSA